MIRLRNQTRTALALASSLSSQPSEGSYAIRRSFWGIGDILGVITAPGQTLQQLGDLRKELQTARDEMAEKRERDRLQPVRTFTRMPGYFPRKQEEAVIARALAGLPNFTVVFGASSVGKTTLLRQVLTAPRYAVLPLDLRVAGFADTISTFYTLSCQFEQYFHRIGHELAGFSEECETMALSFKHQRLDVERRADGGGAPVGVSDIASLCELLQNALVRYWKFQPKLQEKENDKPTDDGTATEVVRKPPEKKIPVWFIDEAHKLPDLVEGEEDCLKTLLDAMVVLTKQERLCHIVHATSDSIYMNLLMELNIAPHVKFLYVDDPDKQATQEYVRSLLQSVPKYLQAEILEKFDQIYAILGGKFLHWEDAIREWVEEGVPVTRSSHVLQAYILVSSFLHPTALVTSSAEDEDLEVEALRPPIETVTTVFSRLASDPFYLPYFPARREFGGPVIDDLLRAHLVEVKWNGAPDMQKEKKTLMHESSAQPVLTAVTPAVRWAMSRVAKELTPVDEG